jgi:hypothetical protein
MTLADGPATVAGSAAQAGPMTAEQRAAFDRDGYLIIRGALSPDETAAARAAVDRVYAAGARAGALAPDGSMHLLGAVAQKTTPPPGTPPGTNQPLTTYMLNTSPSGPQERTT